MFRYVETVVFSARCRSRAVSHTYENIFLCDILYIIVGK